MVADPVAEVDAGLMEAVNDLLDDHGPDEWAPFDALRGLRDAIYAALLSERHRAEEAKWLPMESAPKDGSRILAWVCSRGSIRRGVAEIVWWVEGFPDYGDTWMANHGPVDRDAVKLWQPIIPPPHPGAHP